MEEPWTRRSGDVWTEERWTNLRKFEEPVRSRNNCIVQRGNVSCDRLRVSVARRDREMCFVRCLIERREEHQIDALSQNQQLKKTIIWIPWHCIHWFIKRMIRRVVWRFTIFFFRFRPFIVIPVELWTAAQISRHYWGGIGLPQEVQRCFGLRKQPIPERPWKVAR